VHRSYQLQIVVPENLAVTVGRLGLCEFACGRYVYTGSAARNLAPRLRRHLTSDKTLRWHIDYLLIAPGVHVEAIAVFAVPECALNAATPGTVTVARFGASDCRSGCGSHLKYVASLPPDSQRWLAPVRDER
jgi:Uri superfamily endonuclease